MSHKAPFDSRRLEALAADQTIDVLILGAGVNGAGLFRDLCEQGIRCLLVDKGDFGSGTSAAPSRLIHGGLKYLETGEFGLVAQSTLERNLLLKNAPHFVKPLPTLIPIFSWSKGILAALRTLAGSVSAPRSRGALLIKIGLALYDFYGAKERVMPRHQFMGKRRALADMPQLTPEIVAAGIYHDAWVSQPERLVLELIKDGLNAQPDAAAINHTDLQECNDGLLRFTQANGSTFAVRPTLVVNAAGPWIDTVNAKMGIDATQIGGTKGSHMLLKNDALVESLKGRMIYFEADDGRICLVYDYLGLAMVGSTDMPSNQPDSVVCEPEEIDYFLESLQTLLPAMNIQREQIVYTYSGVRPLPASDATNPGLISRDHSAPIAEADEQRPYPVISLIGGKWTTFRGFAEEVCDVILQRLSQDRKISTRQLPIGGGRGYPGSATEHEQWLDQHTEQYGIDRATLTHLLLRYGTTAREVAAHTGQWTHSDKLTDAPDYTLAEIDYLLTNESIGTLADIVMRRTTLAISGSLTLAGLMQIAEIARVSLNWEEERVQAELRNVVETLKSRHHREL